MREIPIFDNNGSIQIKFKYQGQIYRLSPVKGGKFDNEVDYKRAKMIADRIALDIEEGKFDVTLSSYKPKSEKVLEKLKVENKKDLILIEREKKSIVDINDLWIKYVEYKSKMLSQTTILVDFKRRVDPILNKLPYKDVSNKEDVIKIRDWLLNHTTVNQTKRIIIQLSACCNWAVDSGLLDVNHFINMNNKIHLPKKDDDDDINPFSINERNIIIQTFKDSRYYHHYYYLVNFLFKIGCRPSEAIPLSWNDIDLENRSLIFNKSYVEGNVKDRLKTQRKRKIDNLNIEILTILLEARDYIEKKREKNIDYNNELNLVFPSPDGNYIDWHNFINRGWKKIFKLLPEIEYRNPYQTRHTFITLMVRQGIPIPDIAKHCGNSSQIILERYAAPNRDLEFPVI